MLFTFEDFELDTNLCELRRGGVLCHVEPQVFDVLAYLVEHRDRLVSKQELLEKIWGHGFVTESTLSSRLMDARRAVSDNGREQRIIRTIHGRGFRFVAPVRVQDADASTADWRPQPVVQVGEDLAARPSTLPVHGDARTAATPVGREEELRLLEALMEDARRGARRIAFVTGEAGIGKTTLVDSFMRTTAEDIEWIALGQCVEQRGAGEPYMPILQALGRCCRRSGAGALIDLLARRAPTWLAQMPDLVDPERLSLLQERIRGATRERMLREMVEALEVWTSTTPFLLVLEDLHWSDPSTLQLLDWLARRRESARLMVLGSIRTTDLRGEDDGLRTLIRELLVSGLCVEVPLSLLKTSATRALLEQVLPGAEVSRELAEMVHRYTEGNPLFIRTLADAWVAGGRITALDGSWRLSERLETTPAEVPQNLQRLVDQQVDSLAPEQLQLVETASVAGMEFSAATLALGHPLEAVEERCHVLTREGRFFRAGELEVWPDGTVATRYAFMHHLQRDAIYQRIPEGRRARVHRQIALRLEEAYGSEAKHRAAELALHFLRGRHSQRAVQYLHRAAEQCMERAAYEEAVQHLRQALSVLREDAPEVERNDSEARLLHLLGTVLLTQRGWGNDEALNVLRQARTAAERAGKGSDLGTILCALATVHEVRGEYRTSQALVERCLQLDQLPDQPLIESSEVLACSLLHQGVFDEALSKAELGSSRFESISAPVWVGSDGANPGVACHYWAALSLWFLGRPADSLARMRASLELAESLDRPYLRIAPEMYAARLHHHRREPDEVVRHARVASALARRHGYGFHEAMSQILLGWAEAMGGRAEGAIERVRSGLAAHEAAGAALDRPYCLAILAEVLSLAGREEAARDALIEGLRKVGQHARSFFWEAELHRMLGEILDRLGEPATESEEALERAIEVARGQGASSLELRAVVSLFRFRRVRKRESGVRSALERIYFGLREAGVSADTADAEALLISP